MQLELSDSVEDALRRGIAISFTAEAQVLRDRWYWYDKQVTQATRTVRLAYQPLTQRWRVTVLSNGIHGAGLSGSLSQHFDTLSEALGIVRRIARWKIAEPADIDPLAQHSIEFRFRLDTAQLPRPMQFGVATNPDWNQVVSRTLRPEPADR